MNRTRNRDAGARRASPRKSPPTQPMSDQVARQPIGTTQSQSLEVGAQPIRAADAQQPVPRDWQSTDLPPAISRSGPPNHAIVRPQEPPTQPQPVMLSGSAAFAGAGSFAAQSTLSAAATTDPVTRRSRIETDYPNLLLLAISLEKMAWDEIDRLSRANDPDTIESNKNQIDLLTILADGFAKIAAALEAYSRDPQPFFAGKAKEIVDLVGDQLRAWWEANEAEARDWCIRLPVLTMSIGALGAAGANMTIATAAASALVGGQKVISAITTVKKRT